MTESNDSTDRFMTADDGIVGEAGEFLAGFRSLQMATVSADGVPDASYAPFVRIDDDAFYVNLSELSTHTGNLLSTPRVSVLFLQAENDSKQLFARKRLSFDADAALVQRDSARWCQVMDLFADKFGEIMGLIRPLRDFSLFCLQPRSAVYVHGLAKAYTLEKSQLARLRNINDL